MQKGSTAVTTASATPVAITTTANISNTSTPRSWGRGSTSISGWNDHVLFCAQPLSHVQVFATPGTVAHKVPLSLGILQARILQWVSMTSSRGIFTTQGLNPGLPHCRQVLYRLSHQGSPRILEWAAYPFSRGTSGPRN